MRFLLAATALLLLSGCLVSPVSSSGGMGSLTVSDTNVDAIVSAAQAAFPAYGYSLSASNYPISISFDKPGGAFTNIMWGSYNQPVTVRATMFMTPIPGTNDIRLSVRVSRVTDAGDAGFEDSTRMAGAWSGEFKPILRKIDAAASGAGAASATSL